jgi:hypothetical protein
MESAMKLSRIFLPLLFVTACAAARSAPERPWTIEVSTTGGFTGRGIGTFAIDSDGKVSVRKMNGDPCRYEATPEEFERIEKLLAAARPRKWRESYVPENSCCDRILYSMTVDEAGDVRGTRWIDAPPPMPADLVALANAIVGGEDSIRADSAERCR